MTSTKLKLRIMRTVGTQSGNKELKTVDMMHLMVMIRTEKN